MKVLCVFGTRPEAIKMVPVCNELKNANVDYKICVTGQHRSMLDQVLNLFSVTPHYDLNIMGTNQTLTHVTNKVLKGLEVILDAYQPQWVVVQGDTSTTFA